ncbi:bifunctional glyoxylate/hydroxypyruvate reductase B [Bacillus aerolatus]|uniref:Glyoxylate/hydroxypyruvate reductase B n=1 Tax=Bacillus aerolatus TaxID=2653354 RepID=A0A6I1FJR4_9BACI|nr:D-glycerate dehydrogenase [Bacillus aerolatus]KAB7706664.1 bifunctional glyoxylate/hydroxypyruvate reductase B [Bacillus aerolatus]
MKPKVVVYKKMNAGVLDFLRETCEVVYFEGLNAENYRDFLDELKEARGLLGSGLAVDRELLDHAPQLEVVSNASVGYDNFDIPLLKERGIVATNTPGVLNETVADTILGLILATARRIPELDQFVKAGQWATVLPEEQFGVDVHHKVLGIIGMGGVGTAVAKRANLGFGMPILYHNRTRNEEAEKLYGATYCTLEELLAGSDYVCLMTPLNPETEKMIGKREFALMKKTGIFINASRGKVIDEAALIEALENKEILAAGLDVFAQEPVEPDNPLLSMKNVVTLPHVGSATSETRIKMARLAAENLIAGLRGGIPPNVIH